MTFCEMFGVLWHSQFYANAILIGFDVADITSSTGEGLQQPRGKILRFLHSKIQRFNEADDEGLITRTHGNLVTCTLCSLHPLHVHFIHDEGFESHERTDFTNMFIHFIKSKSLLFELQPDDDEDEEQKTSSKNELHDQYSIELWPKVKA